MGLPLLLGEGDGVWICSVESGLWAFGESPAELEAPEEYLGGESVRVSLFLGEVLLGKSSLANPGDD